jgi:hypothetical protein
MPALEGSTRLPDDSDAQVLAVQWFRRFLPSVDQVSESSTGSAVPVEMVCGTAILARPV